jgi:DNA-binding transcriptional LysR family regulator
VDLRHLEIFVKVAELGSFSKAADALFLTQPTVSEHIRSLEDELGVRLLDRLGRGATVTKGGALLQGYAQRLLALSREARQAMESFQGRMSGELLVGASTIPGEYILPALIGRFKEKFPDIAITLLIGGSQAVTEWVAEGRAEVGVVGARSGHRGIDFRELLPDDIVLIVSATHPWHGRKQVTMEELRAEPLLLREPGSGTRAALEAALTQAGSDITALRVVGEMGSTQAIKQAVKVSVGVSLVSRRAVEEECRVGSLWCLRVRDLKITRAFYLVTHRERSRSPLAEAFRAFVEAEAA